MTPVKKRSASKRLWSRTSPTELDQQGYVTTAKPPSLAYVSLFVWTGTLILYRIMMTIKLCPDYPAFCFISSLLLSVGGAVLIVRNMQLPKNTSSKIVLVIMNTFVIYTSANGIQAGNSRLFEPAPDETCVQMSLLPFLTAKPWLQDRESHNTILALTEENQQLRKELIPLQESGITTSRLRDSLEKLTNKLDESISRYQALVNEVTAYNNLQSRWTGLTNNADSLLRNRIMFIREFMNKYMSDKDYYDNLMSPIRIPGE